MPKFYHRATNILSILKLQDRVYLDGGTYGRSHQYRRLNKQIRLLLEKAGLAYSPENVKMVLSYPFEPNYDVKDPCNTTVCDKKECRIRCDFIDEIVCYAVLDFKPFDYELRVMNVENNIEGIKMGDDLTDFMM